MARLVGGTPASTGANRLLPRGDALPDHVWRQRHRAILVILWLHAIGVTAYALNRGYSPAHAFLDTAVISVAGLVAANNRLGRRRRALAASFGLLSSSALLVHFSSGLIEMHFHFFIMIPLVALYHDWTPFLASVAYVLVHHGVFGALEPQLVYNHPAAIANPWRWAGVHALFVAGASAVVLRTWHMNEKALAAQQRVEAQLREETQLVEALNDVGRALASDLDLDSLLQRVTDAGVALTPAQYGAFFYNVERDGGSYTLYTLSGAPREPFESFPMPRNTEIFAQTFAGRDPLRLDDVTQDPRYGKNAPYRGMPPGHLPVRSYLAVPVRSRTGCVHGGLFFGHPEPGRFRAVDERLIVGIAAHAAVAIDNARLYESQRQARSAAEAARRRLEILSEAGKVLAASLDVRTSMQSLCDLVVPSLADWCSVDLLDVSGAMERAAASGDAPALGPDGRTVARLVATRDPRVLTRKGDRLRPARPGERIEAIVVPFGGRHDVIGALAVGSNESARRLGWDDLPVATELAARAGIAVENARLYSAQRTAAETLQHSLLPDRLPEIPGLAMAARYAPAGPDVEVGGDWYDVIPLHDGSVALAMGDVVGRGVAAASLMGQIRHALRAFAHEGRSPSEVVSRLNRLLCDFGGDGQMATLVCAVFDPESLALRLTNAGHPPPLVVAPDGSATYIEEARGVPLGVAPESEYPEALMALAPASTFVLYTDGLVESRTMPLDDGLRRLQQAVTRPAVDLDELCDTLLTLDPELRAADDVAVLALRCLPAGDELNLRVPARPGVLRHVRMQLRRWLRAIDATDDEIWDVLVAVGEASANAIQHSGIAESQFVVDARLEDGCVHLSVRDGGRWRRNSPNDGGHGLEVMRAFMDEVLVETGDEGTTVRMRKSIGSPARAPRS